jgi:DNA-binding beta-propeller fold protein YncE
MEAVMRGCRQFTLAVVALAGAVLGAQGQYVKIAEVPVGGAGSWDYATVDSAGTRLYVSHATEVVVIDTANDKVVGRIAAGPGVHGIAVVPALNRVYITNGRGANPDGSLGNVSVVDAKTLETLSRVPTGLGPDAILYEPKHKEIYSFNHAGKSVTTFDAASGKVSSTIPLAGVAEFGQVDGDRAFVNIEDKDSIDVIDIDKHAVVGHWPVAPAESPTGMALDAANHRLFVGGGKAVVMIDDRTGKVMASAPICDGTDATAYDPSAKLVFVSCSDGKVTIAHVEAPDALKVVQTLETAPRSRTMTIDPATRKIYLAAISLQPPDPAAPPPAAGQRGRGPAPVPDSFKVLVFGPK